VLAYADVAEATDWLCNAFGFRVRLRIADHRAQLVLGDGAMVVTELGEADARAGAAKHSMLVRVEDADSHHEQAVRRGARILNPPTDYPYGERQYTAEDLGGHRWTFSLLSRRVARSMCVAITSMDRRARASPARRRLHALRGVVSGPWAHVAVLPAVPERAIPSSAVERHLSRPLDQTSSSPLALDETIQHPSLAETIHGIK
jgi:uncharacterized glyoxalase superfamily protein PhnB